MPPGGAGSGAVQLSASARAGLGAPGVAAAEAADASLRAVYDGPPVGGADAVRRRAAFRSRQRGWLEVDLLLGSWASEARLAKLDARQLAAYERILALETADLFAILQGDAAGTQAPNAIRDDAVAGPLLREILAYIRANPVASPAAYAAVKKGMSN